MPILIRGVHEDWGCLGNMSPHPVLFQNPTRRTQTRWKTAEHLFQFLRFADTPENEDIRRAIWEQPSPIAAKRIAKRLIYRPRRIVESMSEQDVANMRLVLRLKFQQHLDVRDLLLLSTGDEEIIENCTTRPRGSGLFWGAEENSDGTRNGKNVLGELLMELRVELRSRRK